MSLIQIILPIFFVLATVKAVMRYRKNDITLVMMLLWLVLWVVGIYIVLNPNSTFHLAKILGVARGADVVMYIALAVLFFVVFRLLVTVEKLKKEIVVLTREVTLKDK